MRSKNERSGFGMLYIFALSFLTMHLISCASEPQKSLETPKKVAVEQKPVLDDEDCISTYWWGCSKWLRSVP